MLSRLYSWLTGNASHDTSSKPTPLHTLRPCTPVHWHQQPRKLPTPQKRRKVTPVNFCRSYQSCSSIIDGYSGSRPTTYEKLSVEEKLDKFRSIREFVDLADLETRPPFSDHSFVSGVPLTAPFFRAILEHSHGPRQLPPHRWAAEACPVNNTAFIPPAIPAPSPDDVELAFTPSRRWAWGAHKSIHGCLPIDRVQGSNSMTFKYGVLGDFPLIYVNSAYPDTISFLREITLHRERLCSLQGSMVMHPISATRSGDRLSVNFEPPHHSFWISASPSMPECLKVLVKCAYSKLHKEGVVHGDVSLRNILITPNLDVFLQDFRHTPNVLVKIDGISNSLKALPEQMVAEKVRVNELLQRSTVDEPIFTIMPGQSKEDLTREVQEFLLKLDTLEQDMFRHPQVPEEYRGLLFAFEIALSPLPLRHAADRTPTRVYESTTTAREPNKNGKRRASDLSPDVSVGSPSKRARSWEGSEESDMGSGSSQTLRSDSEEDDKIESLVTPHGTSKRKLGEAEPGSKRRRVAEH